MKKETFILPSAVDGLKLHAIEVRPDGSVLGVMVLVHGMAEHKERYLPFMEYLADTGYASLIFDERGHGESVKFPEDLGYLYEHGETADVEDVQLFVEEAKNRFPGLPVHLFGHSMGSLIVRNYIEKYDDQINTLTISGCVANNPVAGVGKFLAGVIGMFHGERYKSPFMVNLSFGSYNKNFKDAKSAFAWLNTDEEAVAKYEADPLCGFPFTINGYKALLTMIQMCFNKKNYQMKQPDLPILFISGSDDPCCNGEQGFKDTVQFLKDVGYTKVESKMFEGMRHEILNEPEHQIVYEKITEHIGKFAPMGLADEHVNML